MVYIWLKIKALKKVPPQYPNKILAKLRLFDGFYILKQKFSQQV